MAIANERWEMSYARARLWLGISGVGTIVVIATSMLIWQIPQQLLPGTNDWGIADLWGFLAFSGALGLLMVPFDFLGGYHRSTSADFHTLQRQPDRYVTKDDHTRQSESRGATKTEGEHRWLTTNTRRIGQT